MASAQEVTQKIETEKNWRGYAMFVLGIIEWLTSGEDPFAPTASELTSIELHDWLRVSIRAPDVPPTLSEIEGILEYLQSLGVVSRELSIQTTPLGIVVLDIYTTSTNPWDEKY